MSFFKKPTFQWRCMKHKQAEDKVDKEVVSAMEEKKEGRGIGGAWQVHRGGGWKVFHEKLTFEHKTEIHFSGTSILGKKTTNAKALRQWIGLKCPKNSKKASKAAI